MKKTIISIFFLLAFDGLSIAQIHPICNAIAELEKKSFTKFADITGQLITTVNSVKFFNPYYFIEDEIECFIVTSSDGVYCEAHFGNFNSMEAAKNKLKFIQAKVLSCFSSLEFIEYKDYSTSMLPYYSYLKENSKNGFHIHNVEFGFFKQENSENFVPYMKIRENAKMATFNTLSNEPSSLPICLEINRVLKEADNGFKNIIGEKIPDLTKLTINYKTKFRLTGFPDCVIENTTTGKEYHAFAARKIEKALADSLMTNLLNGVAYALGKAYVWSYANNGVDIIFTESTKAGFIDKSVIDIKEEDAGNNKFNILLIIKKPSRL